MPTLLKIVSEHKTEQPNATSDSTDEEIENLTSIIEKLNKEFDKTDSNSERCRLGDSIGTAMKNREDLLMKKDERERAKVKADIKNITIRFGEPSVIDVENCRKAFGPPKSEIKSLERKPESIPKPVVETLVMPPNNPTEAPKQDLYAPGPVISHKCPMCGKPCLQNEVKTWFWQGVKKQGCKWCYLNFRNEKLHSEENENSDDIL